MNQQSKNQEKLNIIIDYLKYQGPLFLRMITDIEFDNSEGVRSSATSSIIYEL